MVKFILITIDLVTPEFITLFYKNIELKYSSLNRIVSNQDTRITSKFWAEVYAHSLIKR